MTVIDGDATGAMLRSLLGVLTVASTGAELVKVGRGIADDGGNRGGVFIRAATQSPSENTGELLHVVRRPVRRRAVAAGILARGSRGSCVVGK